MPKAPDSDQDEAIATVEEALAGFADLLSPAEIDEARELLTDVISAHPLGRLLAERLRERAPNDRSHERPATSIPPLADKDLAEKDKATGDDR